jgi:hypothetical protein
MVLILACISPFIVLVGMYSDPYLIGNCTETIESQTQCSQYSFNLENVNNTFVECIGIDLTSTEILCIQSAASILPQLGLFHTLSLSLMSSVVFYSEPAEFASEIFVPSLEGASCVGTSCSFMFARGLLMKSLGFMLLGACLLLILGSFAAYITLYPCSILIWLR